MATYYPYLRNQTENISFTYSDQMYLPQPSSGSSYTEQFSMEKSISDLENSISSEQNNGEQNLSAQALSLSLGTQFPPTIDVPTYEYQYVLSPNVQVEYDFEAYKSPTPTLNFCNVEYMKAAQGLLDEIVSVQKISLMLEVDKQKKINKFELFGSKYMDRKMKGNLLGASDSSSKASSELSPTERQHLKVNLGNLFSMLDEVDRRYRKYCHQMQIVISSFETMAGHGAAKSYTSLALCTISRQFRCLRDSINGQITKVRQSLGEKDVTNPGVEGRLTRLRIVDQQIRQQAAIHQFGVMRNSWRPQRGLPGNSVSVLRAWLFEHFLHPYPKDSEKIMLSRQTGLTRGQVANWFINARVRLWKPMVEEMYKEEFGDMDTNSSPDPSPRTPTTSKPWCSFKNTIEEEFKIGNTITKTEVDSEPTLIPTIELMTGTSTPIEQFLVPPMNQLKGCTARLGFQNGAHEQIEVDYETVTPKHTRDGDFSGFSAVAKQVSLALGLEQVQNDSLLIASSEMQFGEDYKGDYHCVHHQTNIGSMTKTF